ncbi:MAG TPA: hypothetical protein VLY84_00320 [Dysgonamonadaceae bacterium]|nr:hypothetical protein [Dysgonamonadaceae bacterium]
MKNIVKYIAIAVVVIMLVSNTSKSDFLNEIDNSTDPSNEYFMLRLFKNAKPILKPNNLYFYSDFDMNFTNLGVLSIANVKYGWGGTLRIDGEKLDKFVSKDFQKTYLLAFGKGFKIFESSSEDDF